MGVLLVIVVGVVVALHTIVEPLYHTTSDAQPYAPLWNILDPIMAVAIVLTVIFAYIRKRDVDGSGGATITREFLGANIVFYGIIFVGIMFFWNWFNQTQPRIRHRRNGCGLDDMDYHRCCIASPIGRDGHIHAQVCRLIANTRRLTVVFPTRWLEIASPFALGLSKGVGLQRDHLTGET